MSFLSLIEIAVLEKEYEKAKARCIEQHVELVMQQHILLLNYNGQTKSNDALVEQLEMDGGLMADVLPKFFNWGAALQATKAVATVQYRHNSSD